MRSCHLQASRKGAGRCGRVTKLLPRRQCRHESDRISVMIAKTRLLQGMLLGEVVVQVHPVEDGSSRVAAGQLSREFEKVIETGMTVRDDAEDAKTLPGVPEFFVKSKLALEAIARLFGGDPNGR